MAGPKHKKLPLQLAGQPLSRIDNASANVIGPQIAKQVTSTKQQPDITAKHADIEASIDLACKIGDTLIFFGWVQDQDRPVTSVYLGGGIKDLSSALYRYERPEINAILGIDSDGLKLGLLLLIDAPKSTQGGTITLENAAGRKVISYQLSQALKVNPIFNAYFGELLHVSEILNFPKIRELLLPFAKKIPPIESSDTNSEGAVKAVGMAKIQGAFELVDTKQLNIYGWVLNVDKPDQAVNVEVQVNGKTVNVQPYWQPRPDLIIAGISDRNVGFKIALPSSVLNEFESRIDILVNGLPLSGSPKKLALLDDASLTINKIKNNNLEVELSGWLGGELEGVVFIDGAATGKVNFQRGNNKFSSNHIRNFEIPSAFHDGQPHVYHVEISKGELAVRSDLSVYSFPEFKLNIEHANKKSVKGWIVRTDRLSPIQIGVFFQGNLVAKAIANSPRENVSGTVGIDTANSGFYITFDIDYSPSFDYVYEIRDLETGIALAKVNTWINNEDLIKVGILPDRLDSGENEKVGKVNSRITSKQKITPFAFTKLPPKSNLKKPAVTDVIIPVYGGLVQTAECIQSVLNAKNKHLSRIIIVNDCTPEPRINDYLRTLERKKVDNVLIVHRNKNGGFSQSVNIGMILAGRRDVILLNSDTVVQDGWLDGIVDAAYQDDRIGTVTPLSNNAEICSVPYMCKSLPVNDPDLVREVNLAAKLHNHGKLVDLPVAIGFCMFIRRECIDEIGLFDAEKWGRGYGEEVDFCLKATASGWRHVLATDTFVVHRGGISFGDEKLARVQKGAKKISKQYPFYDDLIQRFIKSDPVRPYRRIINLELISRILPKARVLHLVHGYGGGTEKYVKDLIEISQPEGIASIVLRFEDDASTELSTYLQEATRQGFFSKKHTEKYASDELLTLQADIEKLDFSFIHIHSTFGVPTSFLDWITKKHSYRVTIHDYAWICPRVVLNSPDGKYCGEPAVNVCGTCVTSYKAYPGLDHFVEEFGGSVAKYRKYFSNLLSHADSVLVGVEDVKSRLIKHGVKANYKVVPHPAPRNSIFSEAKYIDTADAVSNDAIRIALIGGISPCKGYHQLMECALAALKKKLPISFLVFGYTMDDDAFKNLSNVTIVGQYAEDELSGLVASYRPHFAYFPNQCPETFSYTLNHCFHMGLWPVCTDIGAPAERINQSNFGTLIPLNTETDEILDALMNIGEMLRTNSKSLTLPTFTYPESFADYYGLPPPVR